MREDEGGADEAAGPVAAAFGFTGIQQKQIPPRLRMGMVAISRVKIADVVGGTLIADQREQALHIRNLGARSHNFEPGRTEKRHRKLAGQANALWIKMNLRRK